MIENLDRVTVDLRCRTSAGEVSNDVEFGFLQRLHIRRRLQQRMHPAGAAQTGSKNASESVGGQREYLGGEPERCRGSPSP